MPTQALQRTPAPRVAQPGPSPTPAAGSRGNGAAAERITSTPVAAPIEKLASPAPVKRGDQKREVLGVQIIGHDVSPTALDACARFVVATLSQRTDVQRRLRREKVALVIVPRDRKMTDLPEFAALRGDTTFDGRMWDDVRGSGGRRVAGGMWAIGVPEENLVECGPDGYDAGYSVGLHELSHTIQAKGLRGEERERIEALYEARKRAGGPWTEAYGASNAEEYFAQATNCFFGANGRVGQNDAAWIQRNDPELYAFLVSVYGPPPRREAANA